MKKFFIALSVLAALVLGVAPAQALVGSPDDVPGADAAMIFICDTSLTTGLNTLHVLMDVGLPTAGTPGVHTGGWRARSTITGAAQNAFHYTIYTVASATVQNNDLTGTPYDIIGADAFSLVGNVATDDRAALEVTIDGTVYYAGYVYYDNLGAAGTEASVVNSTVAQLLFVDMANGKVSGTNWPVMERADTEIHANMQTVAAGMMNSDATSEMFNMEIFGPNGLKNAEVLQGGSTTVVNANHFWMAPRFYILDANAATWLLFWKTDNTSPGLRHINYYDDEEDASSGNITITNEFTIIDVEGKIPTDICLTYPKQGWLDINWPTTGATAANALVREQSILGFSYLKATGSASESWTALTPIARQVDDD
jgi:hypothetical protein